MIGSNYTAVGNRGMLPLVFSRGVTEAHTDFSDRWFSLAAL